VQKHERYKPDKPALSWKRKIRSAYKIGGCPEGDIRLLNDLFSMHTVPLTRTPKRSNLPDQLFLLSRTGQANHPLFELLTLILFIPEKGGEGQGK
jgi:hypothetical protein